LEVKDPQLLWKMALGVNSKRRRKRRAKKSREPRLLPRRTLRPINPKS
jgi:hypothetical protein